jgi:hypothetical protein
MRRADHIGDRLKVLDFQPAACSPPAGLLDNNAQVVARELAGLGIGVVASLRGVAGGELLIPTIVLLLVVDNKLAVLGDEAAEHARGLRSFQLV